VTTIRPNLLPPGGHGPQPNDHGKLAAQRQFFAALSQAQGAAASTAPAAAAPARTLAQPVAQPVAQTAAMQSADAPQKVLRPGSLIDIRV
jgi:hypothetical protein